MFTVTSMFLVLSWLAPHSHALPAGDLDPSQSEAVTSYGVLLDVGSSSTKMKIYTLGPFESFESVPHIELVKSVKFKPGLTEYEDDEEGLVTYLENMLDGVKAEIPEEQHATTPFFMMATAGFRLLNAREATNLMGTTRELLADTDRNPFLYKPEGVTILSGEEEGAYSWTAVNYLLGYFDQQRPTDEAVGILEMGGGSTQIAFIPREPLYAGEFQVTVAGRRYQIYDHSYLGFGIDAIKRKVAAELVEQSETEQESYGSPCMLRGDSATLRVQGLGDVTVTGAGNASECEELVRNLIHKDTGIDCQPKPCAIGGVYQPSVDNIQFYATSAFTYAPNNYGIVGDDNIFNLAAFRDAAQAFCSRSLEDVLAENEEAGVETYPSNDCQMGNYVPLLLSYAYGFDLDTTSIKLVGKIGGQSPDWALGAMLIELSSNYWNNREHFSVTCPNTR